MILTKCRSKKSWIDESTEIAGKFGKLCKTERLGSFPTINENQAAFADCTLRCLISDPYRYLED